jgi:hypothetical protein
VPGVHFRTWYWSRPSRSFPWALFSSIFQRIPGDGDQLGDRGGIGAWRGGLDLAGVADQRLIGSRWPYPSAGLVLDVTMVTRHVFSAGVGDPAPGRGWSVIDVGEWLRGRWFDGHLVLGASSLRASGPWS